MVLTTEKIEEELKDKLFIGRNVKIERWATHAENAGKYKYKTSRKGKVTGVYPYMFMVDFGNTRECFRKSQVFESGVERVILA